VGPAPLATRSRSLTSYVACLLQCKIILWEFPISLFMQCLSQTCALVLCPPMSLYQSCGWFYFPCSVLSSSCAILSWTGLLDEGLDEVTRGGGEGVNESQLKFLEGIWLMSQIRPNVPLLQLGQDHVVIEKLLILRTRLGP
jgi:hypothetical protein